MPNLWDAVFSWKNIIRAMSEGHPVLILMARLINYICTLSMLLSLCWALTAESSLIGYTWLSLINDDPCQAKRWNKVKCMCFSWQPLSFHKDFYIKFSSKGVCSFFQTKQRITPLLFVFFCFIPPQILSCSLTTSISPLLYFLCTLAVSHTVSPFTPFFFPFKFCFLLPFLVDHRLRAYNVVWEK